MKNKVLAVLLSLVIAFALWLYVITVVSPGSENTFYDIPVVLQNDTALTNRGLMVTNEDTPTVTLKLSGNRTDLNKLNKANITLIADLSKIYDTGEQELSYSIVFPGDIPPNAFTIESQIPRQIKLNVERRISREVPVEVDFVGQVAKDFMADTQNFTLDHETVTVTGPSPVIDKIAKARFDVDLTDRSEDISEAFRFELCDAQDAPVDVEQVTANVGEVNLTMKIQRVKEIPLKLTVVAGGGATEQTSKISIDPATIKVCGSDIALQDLNEIVLGTVNLGDLMQDVQNRTYAIKLPEGVTNLTNVSEAHARIEFPLLKKMTFKVTNIQTVNLPEGMTLEMVTKELQVTVRGPRESIDKLKASDIVVTVDLTGASLGVSTLKATVSFGSNFKDVGALGSYGVSVNLLEKTQRSGAEP